MKIVNSVLVHIGLLTNWGTRRAGFLKAEHSQTENANKLCEFCVSYQSLKILSFTCLETKHEEA